MTSKITMKKVIKQLERDLKYFQENYDFTENEVYEYLYETTTIRYNILKDKVEQIRKNNNLSNENPFA